MAVAMGLGMAAPAQAFTNTINADFEENYVVDKTFSFFSESSVNGWQTTDTAIEIWGNGFQGVYAPSGNNFAEINAHRNRTLFQDLTGIFAGDQIDFSFYHRARKGTDVMNFAITDAGLDNIFGSDDDSVLFSQNYSATTANWNLNDSSEVDPILALGNDVRVSYSAVSTGSGRASVGNFLDNAQIGVSNLPTPAEPVPFELETSLGLMVLSGLFASRKLKKARQASAA